MPGRPIPRVRPCSRSPHSIAPFQCRTYAVKSIQGEALGPVSQDEHQTFRVRSSGEKLPLPPILDPLVVAQKTRWTQSKAKPDVSSFTPFQKKLWENPYAHALAAPVRLARCCSTLLPLSNLLVLHATPHPQTSDPWLLPLALTTDKKPGGAPLRFLAHKHNLAYVGTKSYWRRTVYPRLIEAIGGRNMGKTVWREDMPELIQTLLQTRLADKLRWFFKWRGRLTVVASPRPEDLDALDDVTSVIIYASLRTRADAIAKRANAIVAAADSLTLTYRSGFGAFFDPHKNPRPSPLNPAPVKATHPAPYWYEPLVPRLTARARFPPLEFPTTRWRGRKVALYSLTDLLGEERAKELVAGTAHEQNRCWVLPRGRHTVNAELLLMQMQSYLAEPGPHWERR